MQLIHKCPIYLKNHKMWQVFVAYEAIIDQVNHKCTLVTVPAKRYSPVIFITFAWSIVITILSDCKLQSSTVLNNRWSHVAHNWSMNHIKPHTTHKTRFLHFWFHAWDCLPETSYGHDRWPQALCTSPISSRWKKSQFTWTAYLKLIWGVTVKVEWNDIV